MHISAPDSKRCILPPVPSSAWCGTHGLTQTQAGGSHLTTHMPIPGGVIPTPLAVLPFWSLDWPCVAILWLRTLPNMNGKLHLERLLDPICRFHDPQVLVSTDTRYLGIIPKSSCTLARDYRFPNHALSSATFNLSQQFKNSYRPKGLPHTFVTCPIPA